MSKSVSASVKSVESVESVHAELNVADRMTAVIDVKRRVVQLIGEHCITEDIVEHVVEQAKSYNKTEKLPRKYYEDRNALYEKRRDALDVAEKATSSALAETQDEIDKLDAELIVKRQMFKNRRDAKMKAAAESYQRKLDAIKRETDASESALNSEYNAKQFELLRRQEQLRSIHGKICRDQRAGGYVS